MMIDEEHKHARTMSYRWLVFNAILQSVCLLGIAFTIFLFDLIRYKTTDGADVNMGVITIIIRTQDRGSGHSEYHYHTLNFRPRSDICSDELAQF